MKKSGSEHALALFKAGVAAAPIVGSSLASLIGDYIPTATEKSRDRAIELLRNRLEELGQRIDVEAVNRDECAELFKTCYLSIVRSHHDDKLKAAVAIFVNLLLRKDDPEKLTYTELDHHARCVETLSSGAVEVLGVVVREVHSGRRLFGESKLDWTITSATMDFGTIHAKFPEHSADLLMGLVAELDRANLFYREATPDIQTEDYGNLPIRLTPLGTRFCRFLLDQEG